LLVLIQKRLGKQETRSLYRTFWRVCLAALGMAAVLAIWQTYAPDSAFIQVLVAVPLGLAVYGGLIALLGVKELWQTARLLLRK
jgi:hypothetical protein